MPGQPPAQSPAQLPGQTPGQTPGQVPAAAQPGAPASPSIPGQTPPAPAQQAQPAQSGAPVEPPQGLAKMTLAGFCKEYNLDQAQALGKLKAKGMVVFSDMTFREVAIENTITPEQVMEFMVK